MGNTVMLTIIGAMVLGVALWIAFDLSMAGLFLLLANIIMWWHRRKRRGNDYSLNQ